MEIDISKFEREIADEFIELYEAEMREAGDTGFELTKGIMNIAATTAAIAIKQYHEKIVQEQESNVKH